MARKRSTPPAAATSEDQPPAAMSWDLVVAILAGRHPGPLPEDANGPGFPTRTPTAALPGTEEKILVLIERASRFERLFHHRDAPGRKELE